MSIAALNWAWSAIQETQLSANEKLVLLALAHRHNAKTGQCNPSYDTLAGMVDLSRRRVIANVTSLEGKVDLEVVKRVSKGGQKTNQFILNRGDGSVTPQKQNRGDGHYTPVGGVTGVTVASPNKEEYITNRADSDLDLDKSAEDCAPISHLRLVVGGEPSLSKKETLGVAS